MSYSPLIDEPWYAEVWHDADGWHRDGTREAFEEWECACCPVCGSGSGWLAQVGGTPEDPDLFWCDDCALEFTESGWHESREEVDSVPF